MTEQYKPTTAAERADLRETVAALMKPGPGMLRAVPVGGQFVLRLLADIDRLTAERDAERQRWRPFESAPKDGTEILVYREDAGAFTARYTPALTEDGEEDLECYCWFTTDGEDLTGDLPTHWMPLPPGPAAEKSTDDEIARLTAERDALQARLDGSNNAVSLDEADALALIELEGELGAIHCFDEAFAAVSPDIQDSRRELAEALRHAVAAIRERAALRARLTASEAGAAAMREALKDALPHVSPMVATGYDPSGPCEQCGARLVHKNLRLCRHHVQERVMTALSNPAGAALLEERQRVRDAIIAVAADIERGPYVLPFASRQWVRQLRDALDPHAPDSWKIAAATGEQLHAHDFAWALTQMKGGKRVRRSSFSPGVWIGLRGGLWESRRNDGLSGTSDVMEVEPQALLATDWELAPPAPHTPEEGGSRE